MECCEHFKYCAIKSPKICFDYLICQKCFHLKRVKPLGVKLIKITRSDWLISWNTCHDLKITRKLRNAFAVVWSAGNNSRVSRIVSRFSQVCSGMFLFFEWIGHYYGETKHWCWLITKSGLACLTSALDRRRCFTTQMPALWWILHNMLTAFGDTF